MHLLFSLFPSKHHRWYNIRYIILAVPIYALGFPMLVLYLIGRNRHRLEEPTPKMRYSVLHSPYRLG